MVAALQEFGSEITEVEKILELAPDWRRRLLSEAEAPNAIRELIASVQLTEEGIRITLRIPLRSKDQKTPCQELQLSHFVPLRMRRRGVEMRIIVGGLKAQLPPRVDPALLKAIARARWWFEDVASGRARSLVEIARRDALPKRYVTRLVRLAFLSPAIAEAIAEGRAPLAANLQMFMDGRLALPTDWQEQQPLLFGQVTETPSE